MSKRQSIAGIIALVFHCIGVIGILFVNKEFFIHTTAFHLLLMCALIFFTAEKINRGLVLFALFSCSVGFAAEVFGTSTGLLFGNYSYGRSLGLAVKNVPLIIALNWFMIVYCCAVTVSMVIGKLSSGITNEALTGSPRLRFWSVIVDGAMLAVFFDWIMEPAAVKLGYWAWAGEIPVLNYLSWFAVSALLLTAFQLLNVSKTNKFAVHLLMMQLMFFLIIRVFL